MEKTTLALLFTLLFITCDNDHVREPDLSQIRIREDPSETLNYIGKIGIDFNSALDSLKILKDITSEITKEPLEVLFDYDDRIFWGISFGGCVNYTDVLDTKGYYYLRTWHQMESNNADMQEEYIFNENQTFTIDKDCAKITYQGKIGYDTESALDSLMKRYEQLFISLVKEGHYSGEGYIIDKKTINVDFSYDSREFYLLSFIDKVNIYNYLITGDVIDQKGNYYRLMECVD